MNGLEVTKKVGRWAGPAVAANALYWAVSGVPGVGVAALLAGGGVLLSWGVPLLVKKVKEWTD